MLLVNGEVIDLSGRKAIEKEIAKKKKELEDELGWPVVFRFPEKFFVKLSNGQIQTPGAKRLATKINFHGEKGSMEMIYCKRYWNDANDNIARFPNKIVMDRTLIVNEKDWDLAVFLRYYYPQYGNKYEVVNQKKIESNRFELNLFETKARNYIHTSEEAGITEDNLRILALAYGIDNDDIIAIKNNLWDAVQIDQHKTKQGYTRFLDLIEREDLITIRANVQKAIKLDIIRDYKANKQAWAYRADKDAMGKVIMRYKDANNAIGELVSFLNSKNKAYKELLGILSNDSV